MWWDLVCSGQAWSIPRDWRGTGCPMRWNRWPRFGRKRDNECHGEGHGPKKPVASAQCCLQRRGVQEGNVWLLSGEAQDTAMPAGGRRGRINLFSALRAPFPPYKHRGKHPERVFFSQQQGELRERSLIAVLIPLPNACPAPCSLPRPFGRAPQGKQHRVLLDPRPELPR